MRKQNKEANDLDSARSNFSNLLKKWNRKSHNHEDRNHHYSSTTQSFNQTAEFDEEYDAVSPVQKTKRLKVARKVKKRPADESEYNNAPVANTCMLKLFDRSVDLAQFNDNTPLYGLCRAWVKNPIGESKNLDGENSDEPQSDSMNVDDAAELVYALPDPEPSKRDLRIPRSVKKPTTSTKEIDKAINSMKNEKLDKLLEMNKKRWKEVRTEWKKASLENERRYRKSWLVLKEMYDKTLSAQPEPIV